VRRIYGLEEARDKVIGKDRERIKIGTLSEKSLHAILKFYFEPNSENHEIKLGSFFADAVGENGIVEIQTRGAYRLKQKLMYFLAVSDVTLVLPIIRKRKLIWIDPETGETSEGGRVTKRGRLCDAFSELYGILDLLDNKRLHICVMFLDVTDYKLLDGYGEEKKLRATKFDRIPDEIIEEIYMNCPEDYLELLPKEMGDLSEEFTAKELAKKLKLKSPNAYSMIHVLEKMGLCQEVGLLGRAKTYKLNFEREIFDEQ
jgi:hypothetical protein